jgi:hypothetical protein
VSFAKLADLVFHSCGKAFGESIIYRPKDGPTASIQGIFTKDYLRVQEGSMDSSVSTTAPMVEISESDLNFKPVQGDQLQIRNENYRVVEMQPNGQGQVKLLLKRVSP